MTPSQDTTGPSQTLSPAGERFLRLHAPERGFVERCQVLFGGAMIRAVASTGQTATVRLDEVEDMVGAGLLRPTWGGLFELTEMGRQV